MRHKNLNLKEWLVLSFAMLVGCFVLTIIIAGFTVVLETLWRML